MGYILYEPLSGETPFTDKLSAVFYDPPVPAKAVTIVVSAWLGVPVQAEGGRCQRQAVIGCVRQEHAELFVVCRPQDDLLLDCTCVQSCEC